MSRIDGQQFFLTYARCDATAQQLYDFFCTIAGVRFCRIALEHHEDGGEHRHAVIKFADRVRSRNMRLFDYADFHPNIQGVRSMVDALAYCAKERYEDFGTMPRAGRVGWDDLVAAAAGDRMEFFRMAYEARVPQYIADELLRLRNSADYDLDEYDGRPIQDIVEILLEPSYHSLCVVGPPGCGKTGWAMKYAPRPALLVKHLDCLRRFRVGYHKSIVFDDCDFKHLPRSTQLMLCDYENQVQVHVRYGVAMIPARVPRLFLCNDGAEPFIYDTAIQGRRVQVVHIQTMTAHQF